MSALALLRRGRRKLASLFSRPTLDLVYSRRYPFQIQSAAYDPLRGERILGFLDAAGLVERVHTPEPAPFRLLRRVHTDDYLESLNRPGALLRIVGFELSDEPAERFLESQRTMAAGTVLAVRLALAADRIAVSLGGGLHHAFAARGERFCALNDVAVAIADLRQRGGRQRVLVVDLDLHDGDGTRTIFAEDATVHTFSIHNRTNPDAPAEAAAATVIELGGGVGDEAYLEAVRGSLPPVIESFKPELVIYLAGVDPAADDQIGDWKISAEALLERDRFVVSQVRGGGRELPLAVLLAGGYGPNAWRYSARFLSALVKGVEGDPIEPPSNEEALLMRYRSLARGYGESELTGAPDSTGRGLDDWGLTEEDVGAALGGVRRPRRLLGYYTRQGLELALERTGFLERLRGKGFERPVVELELDNPAGDTLRVLGDARLRDLLIEVRMRVDRRTAPDLALLRIEWLMLQNPRASFTADRPRLPGQRYPGLGMLQETIALFVLACDRLQLDGLLFVPAHFHTASQGRKNLRFLEPADEARFRALEAALKGVPLPVATHAIDSGKVVDARTGAPFTWQPAPMVLPVSERLRERVLSEDYEGRAAEAAAEFAFELRR